MEIQDFIEKVAEQYDDTDVHDFTSNTKFKELGEWSSLIALSIIAMVDDEYHLTLKGDDIRNATTIRDLFNILNNQ